MGYDKHGRYKSPYEPGHYSTQHIHRCPVCGDEIVVFVSGGEDLSPQGTVRERHCSKCDPRPRCPRCKIRRTEKADENCLTCRCYLERHPEEAEDKEDEAE